MNLFIDIGSSNIKYCTSSMCDVKSVSFPAPIINEDNKFEVNAEEIVSIVKTIIDEVKPNNVYFSVQMHGYVLFNKGKRVTNYISWRDERGRNEKPKFVINKDYGVDIKPNLPRLSLQTITNEFDEFMTLGSYISYCLTGNNSSHITDICPSGFYNKTKEKYDEVGIKLPIICKKVIKVGEYNNVNIYSPIGDQQCAVKGTVDAIRDENCYILNIGTASQLCCIEKNMVKGEFESRPYFDGKTLCTVTRLPGGAKMKEYESSNKLVDDLYKEYKTAIERLPSKKKLIVTGGGSKKYHEIIEKVLKKLKIKYEFNECFDALLGLNNLSKGEKTMNKVGIMLSEIPHHSLPVIMKNSGLDFFILDYEHGGFDYESMARIIMTSKLCGLKCIVRLPNNERKDIIKILDMGADGLLLPMTSTEADIAKVVNYAKYPPMGKRGISTMRAHTLYNPGDLMKYIEDANKRIEVYAQIETVEGVKNVGKILGNPGVFGVMVGPNDLSADYDCLADKNAKEILDAIEKVGAAAKKVNKSAIVITGNKNYLTKAKESSYDGVCVGSELNAIKDYCTKVVNDNR